MYLSRKWKTSVFYRFIPVFIVSLVFLLLIVNLPREKLTINSSTTHRPLVFDSDPPIGISNAGLHPKLQVILDKIRRLIAEAKLYTENDQNIQDSLLAAEETINIQKGPANFEPPNPICNENDAACLIRSIQIVLLDPPLESFAKLAESLISNLPGISVHVVTTAEMLQPLAMHFTSFRFYDIRDQPTLLFANLRGAEFTFIAQGLELFAGTETLSRLLLYYSQYGAPIGGAYRLSDGKWFLGCHQITKRNYTLKVEEGYNYAEGSCVACDYIVGPFLVRTDDLISVPSTYTWNTILLDHFTSRAISLRRPGMVCAEIMFHTQYPAVWEFQREQLIPLARKFFVDKFGFPGKPAIELNYREMGFNRTSMHEMIITPGISFPSSCLLDLVLTVQAAAIILDQAGIGYRIACGTELGALKFGSVIPWEADGNIYFDYRNYPAIKNLSPQFSSIGLHLHEDETFDVSKGCTGVCLQLAVFSPLWRLELVGVAYELMQVPENGMKTSLPLGGYWVVSSYNPVQSLLDYEIANPFTHCEHGARRKLAGYSPVCPPRGHYLPCGDASLNCLEDYSTAGNLQFRNP